MSSERQKLNYIWGAMKSRCFDKTDPGYVNYGGRGITVCERWMVFQHFFDDMSPRPSGMMIDRINNDGNYEPDNCKWSTRQEQNSNRRSCIYVVIDGERVTLKEACRRRGLKYRPVHKRIMARGWDVETALALPIGSKRDKA